MSVGERPSGDAGEHHSDERDAAEALRDLLETVVDSLGVEAGVSVTEDDEALTGTLEGDDLGLFIGRHGQTIDAVEHLAQRIVYHGQPMRKALVVDAAGYRARRRAALQAQAEEAAEEALRYGRPVSLDAMTASERRQVHEYLRDRGGVETYSEGTEPDRHLVVAPLVS
jgi:spoIIIJ-associated protein